MTRTEKIVVAAGLVVAIVGLTQLVKAQRNCKVLTDVADEGYETAYDVLYPDRKINKRKQHYGPVWRS